MKRCLEGLVGRVWDYKEVLGCNFDRFMVRVDSFEDVGIRSWGYSFIRYLC